MPSARCSMLDRAEMPLGPEAGVSDTVPVAFRGAGFVPATNRIAGWVALAVVLTLWQIVGGLGLVNPLFLPTPLAILRAIGRLAAGGALWHHLAISVMRIGAGWIIGTAAGVVTGFAIGLSSMARS